MKRTGRFGLVRRGLINTAELVFICTLLAIGLIPGVAAVRWAILHELKDTARAISASDDPREQERIDKATDIRPGDQGGEGKILTAADVFGG